jgi:hypothetical protein
MHRAGASRVGQAWTQRRPRVAVPPGNVIDRADGGRETAAYVKVGARHRQRIHIAINAPA